VRLTKPFYLGKYEVTQEEWKAVMGNNPSRFPGERSPVEMVNWNDCQAFIAKLQPKVPDSGPETGFALPTEAQWEYACRAGTRTRFYFGDDPKGTELGDYAWFKGNSGGKTHAVGEKKPNPWGLYDLSGNVWEWCEDWFGPYQASETKDPSGATSGLGRVIRSGCYDDSDYCRSAFRGNMRPTTRGFSLGFRVALNLPDDAANVRPGTTQEPLPAKDETEKKTSELDDPEQDAEQARQDALAAKQAEAFEQFWGK